MKYLICIDYSGTLSPNMPRFAELWMDKYIRECGLSDYRIPTGQDFFREIVFPVWEQAAIREIPYAKLLAEKICELKKIPDDQYTDVLHKCHCLVQAYYAMSGIELEWKPYLQSWINQKDVLVLVVSDHYYDARNYFPFHFREMGLHAEVLENPVQYIHLNTIYVAISAMAGSLKHDPAFWQFIASNLPVQMSGLKKILLIDDFGYQEIDFGLYNSPEKISARMKNIEMSIKKVFYQMPEIYHFRPDASEEPVSFQEELKKVAEWVDSFIEMN